MSYSDATEIRRELANWHESMNRAPRMAALHLLGLGATGSSHAVQPTDCRNPTSIYEDPINRRWPPPRCAVKPSCIVPSCWRRLLVGSLLSRFAVPHLCGVSIFRVLYWAPTDQTEHCFQDKQEHGDYTRDREDDDEDPNKIENDRHAVIIEWSLDALNRPKVVWSKILGVFLAPQTPRIVPSGTSRRALFALQDARYSLAHIQRRDDRPKVYFRASDLIPPCRTTAIRSGVGSPGLREVA